MTHRLPPPAIQADGGRIVSTAFDDIYFQPEDGLAETEHVFIAGNDLPARFAALPPNSDFVIAELGLGTGLNLLAAYAAFERYAPATARLHFWTCEAHPFPADEFKRHLAAHADRWPALAKAAASIAQITPSPRPGLAQRLLPNGGTLSIWFGDALDGLNETEIHADAWFLDGFSPSKNPDMWSPDTLLSIGEASRPGATAATFTVAGAVRRGLIDAGFAIAKTPGYGRKREMLTARRDGDGRRPTGQRIAIVGGGIAGAWAAWHAKRLGFSPFILEADRLASGASGNPAGLLMPRVDATDTPAARLYRDAFLYARDTYSAVAPLAVQVWPGVIEPANERDEARGHKAAAAGLWADHDFSINEQGVIDVPRGFVVEPVAAIEKLLADIEVYDRTAISSITRETSGYRLCSDDSRQFTADRILIAAGPGCRAIEPILAPDLGQSLGQLDITDAAPPPKIRTRGHYVAPFKGKTLCGATYEKIDGDYSPSVAPSAARTKENLTAAEALTQKHLGTSVSARASVRTTTTDRHPIFGSLTTDEPQSVHFLCGLGSRGLSTGPFLAAQILHSWAEVPGCAEQSIKTLLSPTRFHERRARRA